MVIPESYSLSKEMQVAQDMQIKQTSLTIGSILTKHTLELIQ